MKKEIIGNHTLYLGDSYEIMPELKENIKAVVTDPEYTYKSYSGGGCFRGREYINEIKKGHFINGFKIEQLPKTNSIIFFMMKFGIRTGIEFAEKNNYNWHLISWHKTNPTPFNSGSYVGGTEYALHLWKKNCLFGTYESKRDYYSTPVFKNDIDHPTVKPTHIIEDFILNSSEENEIILDPFMGSGTTGVACEKNRRKFIGIEMESKYFDIACRRIEKECAQLKLFKD